MTALREQYIPPVAATLPASSCRRYPAAILTIALLYLFLGGFNFQAPITTDAFGIPVLTDEMLEPDTGEGSLFTQIFWIAMLIAMVPMMLRDQRRFVALLGNNLLLLGILALCLVSVTWAIEPAIAFRRFVKLIIMVAFALAVTASLPSPRCFVKTALLSSGIVILVDIFAALAFPGLSYDYLGFVGVHGHKNLAGQFAMIAFIIWFFALLDAKGLWSKLLHLLFLALALVILIISQSKTSILVLPLVVPLAWLLTKAVRQGQRFFLLSMCALIFTILAATLPLGLISPMQLVERLYGDTTFTGRTAIWEFLATEIGNSPFLGYGYQSFWNIGLSSPGNKTGNLLIILVGQGHNGYLDVAVQIGLLGLILSVILLLRPFFQLFVLARDPKMDDVRSSAMATMIALLTAALIHNVTESSLLRSGHMMWFFTLFALLYISVVQLRSSAQRTL